MKPGKGTLQKIQEELKKRALRKRLSIYNVEHISPYHAAEDVISRIVIKKSSSAEVRPDLFIKTRSGAAMVIESKASPKWTTKQKAIMKSLPAKVDYNDVLVFIGQHELKPDYFKMLPGLTGEDESTLSKWLSVKKQLFTKYKKAKTPIEDKSLQENAVTLMSLYKHGKDVMSSLDAFSNWLNTPAFQFFGRKPIEYIDTISGRKFIDDKLTALEYGDNV